MGIFKEDFSFFTSTPHNLQGVNLYEEGRRENVSLPASSACLLEPCTYAMWPELAVTSGGG